MSDFFDLVMRAEKFNHSTISFTVDGFGCDLELVSLMFVEVNICKFETYNFVSRYDMRVEGH